MLIPFCHRSPSEQTLQNLSSRLRHCAADLSTTDSEAQHSKIEREGLATDMCGFESQDCGDTANKTSHCLEENNCLL